MEMTDDDRQRLFKLLTVESDRGCALIAAAALDSSLLDCLSLFFVDDKKVQANLLANSMPLGTFSSRIDVCYLAKIINKDIHNELHLIRKIRNQFGHVAEEISFSSPEISDRCALLKTRDEFAHISKLRFIDRSIYILGFLDGWKSMHSELRFLPYHLAKRD